MQPTNRHDYHSILTAVGGLFRAVGFMDAASASVRNSGRRLPHARAALVRLQARAQAS